MEYSRGADRALLAALVALDTVGRLTLPAALLALARGASDAAVVGAIVSTSASALRGFVVGVAVERSLVRAWAELVGATLRRPLAEARVRDEGETYRSLDTLREAALFEAQVRPMVLSHGLALVALAIATAVWLGPWWLVLGGAAAGALAGLVALGQRRLRDASARAWARFRGVVRDASVLLEATALLRAHGRERRFADALLVQTRAFAEDEQAASRWSATLGLLPAGLAVLAITLPGGAAFARLDATQDGLATLGILGGAALLTGLSFARVMEQAMRGAPARASWRALLAAHPPAEAEAAPAGTRPVARSLALADLHIDGVSCVFPDAACATPANATARLAGPGGLAIGGPNGAGKSTLALALLGLVRPATGRVTIDDVPVEALDPDDLRGRVTYLPQGAFTAPSATVAWHLRLVARDTPSDARIDAALAEVGLLARLREHSAKAGCAPRDVPVGELSGGERQRMHLARLFLEDAELVILDEPEAALDDAGRTLLRALLARFAADRKVVVVAHDGAVVPPSFTRLTCTRGDP